MIVCETKIYKLARGALLSPICEQKSLLHDNNSRPGDIFLPVGNDGQTAALDVTVTSPLQSSLIKNTSENSGFALSAARKTLKRIATLADNRNLQLAGLSVALSRLS